jgi:tryptophan halogenase
MPTAVEVSSQRDQINDVLVVGGGTAGFMAAMALKAKLPRLKVTVVRSPEIGIIGVGEGSTPPFARFIHDFLGVHVTDFVRATRPGIKTGTRFHWGPREKFFFPFGLHMSLKVHALPRPIGYYYSHGNPDFSSPNSARMAANRPFDFNEKRSLVIHGDFAYHIENDRLATFLESANRALGVEIIDATIETASQDQHGITAVHLADGRSLSAGLYVDCSGFRTLLLGRTFNERRIEFNKTLFNDRAVVGGWERPASQPMLSYTVSETMNCGWSWRIDHPDRINRGYVYSSAFISDDAAEQEFRTKNPQIGPTRIVKFTSGRFENSWVKNVVAMGNASGFVEPLEATSLAVMGSRCQLLVELLTDSEGVISDPLRLIFNSSSSRNWDLVRDFLSLHYRFNTRLDTPYWQHCRNEIDMGNAQAVVDYYRNVGPSPSLASFLVDPNAPFGVQSYLAILVGQKAPTCHRYQPDAAELATWDQWCQQMAMKTANGVTAEAALAILAAGRQV